MNRKYSTEDYKRVVGKLREAFPDVAIATDLIVGFPGETEEEFQKTVKFIEEISFSAMHIFKYSPREGTPASKYKGQVKPQIKEERSKLVAAIAEKSEERFKRSFIGHRMKVLYEQHPSDDSENFYEGLTDNYIRVVSESTEDIKGKIIETELLRLEKDHISGLI